MALSEPRPSLIQQAWVEGFNVGIELAARRVEKANDETKARCLGDAIRSLMHAEGPSREKIEAMLGIERI